MTLLPFLLAKFILYWLLCRMVPRVFGFEVPDLAKFAFKWAGVRLGVGLVAGIAMFYAYALLQHNGLNDVASYALSFGLGRYFEWLVVLLLILKSNDRSPPIGAKGQGWLALGTGTNIALDSAVLLTGVADDLKFFC